MRRGIFFNLIIIVIFLFLILFPLIVFAVIEGLGRLNQCEMTGMDWGEGICNSLYGIAFLTGLFGSITSPILAGVFGLYLLIVMIWFAIHSILSRRNGRPISPVGWGMFASTLAFIGLGGIGIGIFFGVRWYEASVIGACQSLPREIPAGRGENGLLAVGIKLPEPVGRPEQYVIQILSPEGELVTRINSQPASKDPAWSYDGKQLIYSAQSNNSGAWGLYLADEHGQFSRLAFEDSLELGLPAWTPDGKAVLFQRWREESRNPETEIYRANLEGSELVQLTKEDGFDGMARFSPDGSQIVFVSKRNGWGDIYRMNADGSGLRRLTYHPADDTDPTWSPDGRWIVFASRRANTAANSYNLFIMAADGNNQCQLTQGSETQWRPVWSPDGAWIAYISLLERKIYRVRPDGSDTMPISLAGEVEPLRLDWASKP